MRIQYCSDLHLEFEQNSRFVSANPLQVCGDILILAGDIVPLHDEYFNHPFFRFISGNYKHIFWVPGNHEYYYGDISSYSKSFRISLHPKISIVNNLEVDWEGTRIIFSTLWSKIGNENERNMEQGISDFECIRNNHKKFRVSDFNQLHQDSLDFLKKALDNTTRRAVVVTHYLPSRHCNSNIRNLSPINEAFCIDLTGYIRESSAAFWIYGHSHHNKSPFLIGQTIMLTNQLGYVHLKERLNYRTNAYFSV